MEPSSNASDPEPTAPRASREISEWLDERIPPGTIAEPHIDAIAASGDAPPHVVAFLSSWKTWRAAHEAWSKRQPIERSPSGLLVRLFGGAWVQVPDTIIARVRDRDGADFGIAEAPLHLIADLHGRGELELARRVAAAVYEWVDMRDATNIALVRVCDAARREIG